jgi:hypothetical protein
LSGHPAAPPREDQRNWSQGLVQLHFLTNFDDHGTRRRAARDTIMALGVARARGAIMTLGGRRAARDAIMTLGGRRAARGAIMRFRDTRRGPDTRDHRVAAEKT